MASVSEEVVYSALIPSPVLCLSLHESSPVSVPKKLNKIGPHSSYICLFIAETKYFAKAIEWEQCRFRLTV